MRRRARQWTAAVSAALVLSLPAGPAAARQPGQNGRPDFAEAGREAARILTDLVRLDTTNPPGREELVAAYLAELLDREGITYLRLARDEGRDNLVARYHGAGRGRPILLYSHSDVVPADAGWGGWTVDPFAGEVKDGRLYGRGAVDAKGLLVCHLEALLLLKRGNVPLDRDVIFLAAAAEETGGGPGVAWLLREHRDLLDAGTALGEGGRVWSEDGVVRSVWLQAGEKSAHNLTVTATGTAGHASVPTERNAAERLVRALDRMLEVRLPRRINPVSREFLRRMVRVDPRVRKGKPRYTAITRSTFTITSLESGVKSNVIPPVARANLNLRLLPGEDLEAVTALLQAAARDTAVHVRHRPGAVNGATLVPFETPFFDTLSAAASRRWPGAVVAPYLSPGTSDASKLRRAGILTYGLMPFPLEEGEDTGVHGADERIDLEALSEGVRLTYEILLAWAGGERAR